MLLTMLFAGQVLKVQCLEVTVGRVERAVSMLVRTGTWTTVKSGLDSSTKVTRYVTSHPWLEILQRFFANFMTLNILQAKNDP